MTNETKKSAFHFLAEPKLLVIFILGFASGLPLSLVGTTLQAWCKTSGLDIISIGMLTLLSQPYTYKVFWAPLLDRFKLPFLQRRTGWIVFSQFLIIVTMLCIARLDPHNNFKLLLGLAFLLAILSASQDLVIDAFRVENLPANLRGFGVSLAVEGYRLGMLVSGGLALILAHKYGFQFTYNMMALLLIPIMIMSCFIMENSPTYKEHTLVKTYLLSLKDFLQKPNSTTIIMLILLYKFGEVTSQAFTTAFMLELGFTLQAIGTISKIIGVCATLFGVFIGGLILTQISLYRGLLVFAILQCITNILYVYMSYIGQSYFLASLIICIENICGGMGTAALTSLLTSLCNPAYAATQYALFSSIISIPRIYIGPIAGVLVHYLGWNKYYIMTILFAIPGIILIKYLQKTIDSYEEGRNIDKTKFNNFINRFRFKTNPA